MLRRVVVRSPLSVLAEWMKETESTSDCRHGVSGLHSGHVLQVQKERSSYGWRNHETSLSHTSHFAGPQGLSQSETQRRMEGLKKRARPSVRPARDTKDILRRREGAWVTKQGQKRTYTPGGLGAPSFLKWISISWQKGFYCNFLQSAQKHLNLSVL